MKIQDSVKGINKNVNPIMAILKHGIGMHNFKMVLWSYRLCICLTHIHSVSVALLFVYLG